MCETDTLDSFPTKGFSRRQFGAMGAVGSMGALAACTGMESMAGDQRGLTERKVSIITPSGTMDAFLVHPVNGRHPAVLCWPDIASLREAFMQMARRTAAEGYAVLVVNPYYRDLPAPQFADFAAFAGDNGFKKVGPWREKLTAQAIMSDATAAIAWLDEQDGVDSAKGVGTEGYCMGGPFTVWSAAGVATRVRAAASFHGGGLTTDAPTSPHKLLGQTQAAFLFAIAQNDDAKDPSSKDKLRAAVQAAGKSAVVDVYAADHGWTVIDSPAYDQAEAERAYAAKLGLYRSL